MKRKKEGIIYWIGVFLFLLFTLGPIIWCFVISIGQESDLFNNRANLLPNSLNFSNYKKLLNPNIKEGKSFFLAMKNSVITSIMTIILGAPLVMMAGYALARYRNKGVLYLAKLLFLTMALPIFTTIISLYTIFSEYGMLNNLFWVTIIYLSSFLPITIWIAKEYFKKFPIEIEEMALIDGCNRFNLIFKILLPNTYPILITSVLIIFLKAWSQYQIPLILAASRDVKPLTVLITEFSSKDMVLYGQMAAAGILTLLPPLLLAFISGKYFVSGLTKGSS